jgi:hypothetical protein
MLPGKETVDVPTAVKEHDQQGGHYHRNPNTALLNRFKLPEYALYVKELYRVFQAQACFIVAVNESLKFSQIRAV